MKNFFIVLTFVLIKLNSNGQNLTQTVKGTIIDKISEKSIEGASVNVDGTSLFAITDDAGVFVLKNVPLGRIKLNISFTGYLAVSIPQVLLTTGKEIVLDIPLEQNFRSLNEVVIKTDKTKKGNVNNEYAGSSARSFNIEEVTRYAGGRNDPSKLVSNFAGVISNDDSRNDIVVRGNSPAGVLWRIEGLPSPSPNHYSTLGTTGGPISALNTNALKTSDFYTGAFPAEYGNAISAVFDITLRKGNTDKHERTLQVNLFSGLEAMLEGPLNKKKNGASYLVGYRYSFAAIGGSLGLDIGTDAIPKYQDWVYNIEFGKSKAGKFSIFGMGGISTIDFIGKDLDTSDTYNDKDQDNYSKNSFYLFGVKHNIDIGKKSYIKTAVSYSDTRSVFDEYQYPLPVPPYNNRWLVSNVDDKLDILRFSSYINTKNSATFSWRAGLTGEKFGLKTFVRDKAGRTESDPFEITRNFDDNFMLWQYFGQFRYKPSNKFTMIAGLHGMNFSFNSTHSIEPRASLSYQLNPGNTLTLSYGLHGQLQPVPVYLFEKQNSSSVDRTNRNLDFSKAHHFVLGYENRFASDWRLKAEAYYQELYDIPVEQIASGFSMLNAGNDFGFPEKAGLVNNGSGSNTGIELTVEKFFSKRYYLLATASVFDSKYKGSDGIKRNSSYNYGYAANILTGREWKVGKDKRKALTLDIRMSAIGGKFVTPIDLAASVAAGEEILDVSRYNGEQLGSYFRLDAKFGFRINSKKRKLAHTIYLDLQNVTNRDNIFLREYNSQSRTIRNINQIGFFPDILYRAQF